MHKICSPATCTRQTWFVYSHGASVRNIESRLDSSVEVAAVAILQAEDPLSLVTATCPITRRLERLEVERFSAIDNMHTTMENGAKSNVNMEWKIYEKLIVEEFICYLFVRLVSCDLKRASFNLWTFYDLQTNIPSTIFMILYLVDSDNNN